MAAIWLPTMGPSFFPGKTVKARLASVLIVPGARLGVGVAVRLETRLEIGLKPGLVVGLEFGKPIRARGEFRVFRPLARRRLGLRME